MENTDRFPTTPAPSVGIVRGLPHTWEVTALGGAQAVAPAARWSRGVIERGAQPVVTLTSHTPMYDPTDPAQRLAQGWAG